MTAKRETSNMNVHINPQVKKMAQQAAMLTKRTLPLFIEYVLAERCPAIINEELKKQPPLEIELGLVE